MFSGTLIPLLLGCSPPNPKKKTNNAFCSPLEPQQNPSWVVIVTFDVEISTFSWKSSSAFGTRTFDLGVSKADHRCPFWSCCSNKWMAIPGLPGGLIIHQGNPSISNLKGRRKKPSGGRPAELPPPALPAVLQRSGPAAHAGDPGGLSAEDTENAGPRLFSYFIIIYTVRYWQYSRACRM